MVAKDGDNISWLAANAKVSLPPLLGVAIAQPPWLGVPKVLSLY